MSSSIITATGCFVFSVKGRMYCCTAALPQDTVLNTKERGAYVHTKITETICARIKRSRGLAISFRDYMELCLYHPEYGYYMSEESKVGRSGDFYTSASIGGIFGEVLARYIAEEAR